MATRYIKALGTARHVLANGRTWTVESREGERTLAEVCRFDGVNAHSYIGLPAALGFGSLEIAAHWRRRAMDRRTDSDHRILFKRRCREGVEHSRQMRVTRELLAEAHAS